MGGSSLPYIMSLVFVVVDIWSILHHLAAGDHLGPPQGPLVAQGPAGPLVENHCFYSVPQVLSCDCETIQNSLK